GRGPRRSGRPAGERGATDATADRVRAVVFAGAATAAGRVVEELQALAEEAAADALRRTPRPAGRRTREDAEAVADGERLERRELLEGRAVEGGRGLAGFDRDRPP